MTNKPTIFFSHSARDAELLTALKELFCARTSDVYDVFLSSDGTSIPFGHNWQKTIEDALARAHLMFTFLSPHSVGSKWIYFESGFAYAQRIEVIPVGLEGVELDAQPPPLGLLHGFDIRNHEGLNNLIGVANRKFQHTHPLSFEPSDYDQLVTKTKLGPRRALGRHAEHVDRVVVWFASDESEEVWTERFAELPGTETVVERSEDGTNTLGLRIGNWTGKKVQFVVDRLALDGVYPLVESLIQKFGGAEDDYLANVWLRDDIRLEGDDLRRSASIIGTSWTQRGMKYSTKSERSAPLSFELCWHESEHQEDEECAFLGIKKVGGLPSLRDLREMIDLCFDHALLVPPTPMR